MEAEVMAHESKRPTVILGGIGEEAIAGKIGPPKLDKGGRRHYRTVSFRFRDREWEGLK